MLRSALRDWALRLVLGWATRYTLHPHTHLPTYTQVVVDNDPREDYVITVEVIPEMGERFHFALAAPHRTTVAELKKLLQSKDPMETDPSVQKLRYMPVCVCCRRLAQSFCVCVVDQVVPLGCACV